MKKQANIKKRKTKLRPKKWVRKILLTFSMIGMIITSNYLELKSISGSTNKIDIYAHISEFDDIGINNMQELKSASKKALNDLKRKQKQIEEDKKRKQLIEQQKKQNELKYQNIVLKTQYSGKTKTYMDLNKITKRGTKQYSLKQQYQLDNNGVYYYSYKGKKFYTIALGSYFGEVGTKYLITLDSGKQFYCIKADEKANVHTVDGYAQKYDGSVIEFVINTKVAYNYYGGGNGYVLNGNFNNHNDWKGNIVSIKKVV